MGHARGWLRQRIFDGPSITWFSTLRSIQPDNMKLARSLILIYISASVGVLKAQCDLVISTYTIDLACYGPDYGPDVSVTLTGGTPPYTFRIETGQGELNFAQSNVPYLHRNIMALMGDDNATLLVTDAEGCTATGHASWVPHHPLEPDITTTATCDGIVRFNWNGRFRVGGTAVVLETFQTCQGPFQYEIGFLDYSTLTGAVASDWTLISPGNWRYELPIPTGVWYIRIHNQYQCDLWSQVHCYEWFRYMVSSTPPATGCNAQLAVRAALAGALPSGTLMTDHLRVAGSIPTTEPYSALGYSYVGSSPGASIAPSMLTTTGNNAIVDWVVIELRSAATPGTVAHSRPALLQRDGDVVGLTGQPIHTLPFASGNYHVGIRHRNHLGVMTSTPRALSSTTTSVDFTQAGTATYGTNAQQVVGTMRCLWPGDCNGNGNVQYAGEGNDRDQVLVAIGGGVATNAVPNVYSRDDVNMDGTIMYTGLNNDRDVILQVIGGVIPTAVRTQQLP